MKQNKRPSRKHRRRPKNLLAEYNRRQRNHVWLETHIWHAKRFHMIEKWGYKLPWKPTDKSLRACYRASTRKCLIQVINMYNAMTEIVCTCTNVSECILNYTFYDSLFWRDFFYFGSHVGKPHLLSSSFEEKFS